MRDIDYIEGSITDLTLSVVSRFESFDRDSETMWEVITAESFNQVKKIIRGTMSPTVRSCAVCRSR